MFLPTFENPRRFLVWFVLVKQSLNKMFEYPKYLIQQLNHYNKKLTDISIIQNKWWVVFDYNETRVKWLFQPNGNLLISANGDITYEKWEYLTPTRQLILNYHGRKELLNQNYFDKNILVVCKDASNSIPIILYDDKEFSRNQFLEYLFIQKQEIEKRRARELNIKLIELENNKTVEVYRRQGQVIDVELGNELYHNGELVKDNVIRLNKDKVLELNNGVVETIFYIAHYNWEGLEIEVKKALYNKIRIGDIILKSNRDLYDGFLRIGYSLGVLIKECNILGVFHVKKAKTIFGKEFEVWSVEGLENKSGYLFRAGEIVKSGNFLLSDFTFIKVANGRLNY